MTKRRPSRPAKATNKPVGGRPRRSSEGAEAPPPPRQSQRRHSITSRSQPVAPPPVNQRLRSILVDRPRDYLTGSPPGTAHSDTPRPCIQPTSSVPEAVRNPHLPIDRTPRPEASNVREGSLGSQHRDSTILHRRKLSRDRAENPWPDVEEAGPSQPVRNPHEPRDRTTRPQVSDVTDGSLGSQHRDSTTLNRRKSSRDQARMPWDKAGPGQPVEEVRRTERRKSSITRVGEKIGQIFTRSESKEKMKKSKAKRDDDEQFDSLPDEFFNEKRRGGHRKDDKDGPGGSSGFGFLRNRVR